MLEVIRKYLTTPQIIAVLSGDINLYSIMVRQNQFRNFDPKLIGFDNNDNKYKEVLNNLEKEYLLKVLKTERRIELITLDETLQKYNLLYDGKHSIETFVSEIFQQAFCIHNSNDKRALQRYFFRESIRFNQNFLRAARQNWSEKTGYFPTFYSHLVDMFFVPLDQGGFRPIELKHPNPANLLDNLLLRLVQNNLLERGFRLRPDFNDNQIDGQMIVMGALVTHLARDNNDLYFKYFIKIALTQTILEVIQQANSSLKINDYISYIGIRYNNYSISIARKASACMHVLLDAKERSGLFRQVLQKGLVTLRGLNRGTKGAKLNWKTPEDVQLIATLYGTPSQIDAQNRNETWLKDWIRQHGVDTFAMQFHAAIPDDHPLQGKKAGYFNRIDDLYNGISSWHRHFVYFPLTLTKNAAGYRIPIYSIYPVIAALGELLYYAQGANNEQFTLLTTVKWIADIIDTPPFTYEDQSKTAENNQEVIEFDNPEQPETVDEESGDTAFFKTIQEWIDTAPAQGISVVVLARAWSRFMQTLESQDNLFKIEHYYLGHLLHRQIIAFLNALLIEESWSVERGEIFRNATLSDKPFYDNIRLLTQTPPEGNPYDTLRHMTPFFHWIASCPMWGLYIAPDLQPESLWSFILRVNNMQPEELKPTYHGGKFFDNLFSPLNSVLLAFGERIMHYRAFLAFPDGSAEEAPTMETEPATERTGKRNASLALSARDREFLDLMTENRLFRRLKSERLQYEEVDKIAGEIASEFLRRVRHYRLVPKSSPVMQVAREYIINLIYPKG
ncbi:MAG: hypothetical protein HQL96_05135 [Magnetococcales bacterium]|nr:hypothetical protein [Magnetococcales bacterium]